MEISGRRFVIAGAIGMCTSAGALKVHNMDQMAPCPVIPRSLIVSPQQLRPPGPRPVRHPTPQSLPQFPVGVSGIRVRGNVNNPVL